MEVKMQIIDSKDIKYCKEGKFFFVKWREDPSSPYELIKACHTYDEVVHAMSKQGIQVLDEG
tara:strand:+ start:725 stop:910 length:186 start_codon:yes stop_codon:yes gene_type:complete